VLESLGPEPSGWQGWPGEPDGGGGRRSGVGVDPKRVWLVRSRDPGSRAGHWPVRPVHARTMFTESAMPVNRMREMPDGRRRRCTRRPSPC